MALVPVFVAGALATSAPAAPPATAGKGHGNGAAQGKGNGNGNGAAPGKGHGNDAPPARGHGNDAPPARGHGNDAPPGTGDAKAPAPAPSVRGKAQRAPGHVRKAAQAGRADAPATSAGAGRSGKRSRASAQSEKTRSAAAARPAAADDAAPAQPPAPAAAAVAAAPAAVTPQPASAAPAAQPTASAAPRRRARSTRSPGRIVRRAPRARRTSGQRAPAAVAPLVLAAAPATAAATRAGDVLRRGEGAAAPDRRSPLTRTVVRVLEVIPTQVRIALAALALLGLLLAAATAVQTVRSRRLVRQRRLLLDDVGVLQSALLPDLPERIGGARVTAAYRPAAGLAAGGDFYDAFALPGGRTAVIVGDVAGHGRDAVPLTALVRYNLRAYLEAGLAPRATLHVASNVLAPQLGGRQVTIVVAIYDPGTGRLTYACAGHWPPLLLGTETALVTACSSPPIGAGAPTGRRQTTVALAPGASACFHTDGLGEVPVGRGRRLGRAGVDEALQAIGSGGTAADLIARIVRRSDEQPDDMAACIVTALPGAAANWTVRLEELEVDAAMLHGGWAEQFLVACGVGAAHITRALAQARQMIAIAGTAIVEVRVGEEIAEVRVGPPPAVSMLIARRPAADTDVAATA
ncbi:MAG: PP2C family protein-serine/threonine phosphatase [Thermoleophilia bacterium]